MILVNYLDNKSIKSPLAGLGVVISTIARVALEVQGGVAEATREAVVTLFTPSEFRTPTIGITEVYPGQDLGPVEDHGHPVCILYTGLYADII